MKVLALLIPFILSFNYKASLNEWEIKERNINAHKLSIRSNLSQYKESCNMEVIKKLFPVNCFKLLNSMKTLNPSFNFSDVELKLNQKCINSVFKLVNLSQIKEIEPLLYSKSECKDLVLKQKVIINYKLEN